MHGRFFGKERNGSGYQRHRKTLSGLHRECKCGMFRAGSKPQPKLSARCNDGPIQYRQSKGSGRSNPFLPAGWSELRTELYGKTPTLSGIRPDSSLHGWTCSVGLRYRFCAYESPCLMPYNVYEDLRRPLQGGGNARGTCTHEHRRSSRSRLRRRWAR